MPLKEVYWQTGLKRSSDESTIFQDIVTIWEILSEESKLVQSINENTNQKGLASFI